MVASAGSFVFRIPILRLLYAPVMNPNEDSFFPKRYVGLTINMGSNVIPLWVCLLVCGCNVPPKRGFRLLAEVLGHSFTHFGSGYLLAIAAPLNTEMLTMTASVNTAVQ